VELLKKEIDKFKDKKEVSGCLVTRCEVWCC
jgi:hypothetical protein